MAILIYVIVISLVIVALIQFGLPAYYRANQKLEGVKTLDSSSSLRTIILALILPLSIGFSFAFMAAKIAACGGWLNPGFIIGLVAGIVLSIILIQLIPRVFKAESKVIVGGALVVSLMIALSSFLYSPALDNFNSVDAYHHPIYEPVGTEVVNSVISFLGNAFPMEDYPVIHTDNTIYSPESSFINTFANITNLCYLIVSFISLYAIVTGPYKRDKERILRKIEMLEK